MKKRLIVGVINRYYPEEGWQNWHLDVSDRGIWDPEIEMTVYPDFVGDVADLADFRDETFDEVRAHHVLEHLTVADVESAAEGVHRILVPGGVFDVEVPDVSRVGRAIESGELERDGWNQWLYGEALVNHEPGDTHRSGWTYNELSAVLGAAGFGVGVREETGLALRLLAYKA